MFNINKFCYKVKKVDSEERTITIVGSTEDYDRVGDKMYMSGVRLENYLKNPIVLANHSYGEDEKPTVIGKALDVRVENNELIFVIKFAETSNGNDWYYLYANGFMNASSIGFNPIKSKPNQAGGYDYLEWELLEISLVSVPCNQNAVIQHAFDEGRITKSMLAILKGEETNLEKENMEEIVDETKVEETEVETEEIENQEVEAEVETEEIVDETIEKVEEPETMEEEKVEEPESEIETEVVEEEVEEKAGCEKPEKKSFNDNKVNRKIKFAKSGGNEMNKYEKVAKYFKAKAMGDIATEKALSGGTDAAGKSLLPIEFVEEVIDRIAKDPVALRNLVNVYPVSTRSGWVPVAKTGIEMSWVESDAAFSEKEMTFDKLNYAVNTLQGFTAISQDLLDDTPINLFNILAEQYAKNLVKAENAAILAGDGSNKPEGILNAVGVIEKTCVAAMTGDDILGLPYEVDVTWRSNGVYIVPTKLMKEIRLMKDGDGKYLFVQGDATKGAPSTLGGYPVIELANVGDNKIIFGDLKQYMLFDRQELVSEVNTQSDTAFKNNQALVKYSERLDGKVAVPAAFVKLNQHA